MVEFGHARRRAVLPGASVTRGSMTKSRFRCLLLAVMVPTFAACDPSEIGNLLPRPSMKARTASDAMTPEMKDPERRQQFLQQIGKREIDLLFLGDSITESWPSEGKSTWVQLANYKPANFGVSADRTENLLWRITNGELDGINPRVVVVLIGTNNIGYFEDERPEWIANGIKQIVATVHERLPQTKVLLLGIFPRDGKETRPRKMVREVNERIRNPDDGNRTRFLDLGQSFLDEEGNILPEIMADQLHLTAKGYEIWFEKIRPILDEMMR